jgi:hypothetical protein
LKEEGYYVSKLTYYKENGQLSYSCVCQWVKELTLQGDRFLKRFYPYLRKESTCNCRRRNPQKYF